MLPDDVQGESQKRINQVYDNGQLAQARMPALQRWEQSISAVPDGQPLQAGALHEGRTIAANLWNTTMDQFHLPQFKLDPDHLDNAVIAEKTSRGAAALAEAENQQRSLAGLYAFLNQTPNATMPRSAALKLIADMHMENVQAIDKKNYLDEFDHENQRNYGPMARNYLASDALQAFDKDHNALDYDNERNRLQELMSKPGFAKWATDLQNSSGDKRRLFEDMLDERYGKNFRRYFKGT
jgi:hypothetical protein